MKRYGEYKDSGVEWIGEIPKNWELTRLRFLCDITTGDKDTVNAVDEGKYPFYVRSPNIETIDSYTFDGEAILTAGDGVGAGKVFHYANGKFDFHQRVYNLHNFRKTTGKYLFYYMQENFYKEIERGNAKSTVDSIRMPMLQNFPISFPDEAIQRAIAAYLDKRAAAIDTLITDKLRLIDLLKEKRQAVISEAVIKGLDPAALMTDRGIKWIGEIPAHWEVSRFLYETWVRARLGWKGLKAEEYVDEGYAFLSTPNIKNNDIDFDNVNFINKERYDESPEIILRIGDVLLAKDGSTLGTVNVVRNLPREATVNSSIAVITPNNRILGIYLMYFIKSSYMEQVMDLLKGGMGVPHLFQDDIRRMKLLLPPISEQEELVAYLDTKTAKIDSLITDITIQIEKLKEYRQSIITEAVTGKVMIAEELITVAETPLSKRQMIFKRLVLSAYILDNICDEPTTGRVKFEKLLFLSEYCAELTLLSNYRRYAAGPFDPKTLFSIEEQLKSNKWFGRNTDKSDSKAYIRLGQTDGYKQYMNSSFNESQKNVIDKLIRTFKTTRTIRCEIIATLYGAWNDFLIEGINPTDEQIVNDVLTNWHEKKERIERQHWLGALNWMRKQDIVPVGYGISTKGGKR